jgi:hypothetical protein
MKRPHPIRTLGVVATLAAALAIPRAASALDFTWEDFKEDFKYHPVAYIVALPAFVVTAPFMAAAALIESIEEDDAS